MTASLNPYTGRQVGGDRVGRFLVPRPAACPLAVPRICPCPARALYSRMGMRFSARAGVRPGRCPVPCPRTETLGFICHHACPPRHQRLLYGLCTYIKSGSPLEGLFSPGPVHSPPSSYTGVSGVRNRVRISWRYGMATGSRSIRNWTHCARVRSTGHAAQATVGRLALGGHDRCGSLDLPLLLDSGKGQRCRLWLRMCLAPGRTS